jgi:hypothetical protein
VVRDGVEALEYLLGTGSGSDARPMPQVVLLDIATDHPLRAGVDVLDPSDVDACVRDPGFEDGMVVDADMGALARVWVGRLPWSDAVRAGGIKVEGRKAIVQALPGWLQTGPLRLRPAAGARRLKQPRRDDRVVNPGPTPVSYLRCCCSMTL